MIHTIRFNITLPQDIGSKLQHVKNKSAIIAESLREKFRKAEEKKELTLLAEAYAASAREEQSLRKDWETTAGDSL